jgi:hypothetical protein
MAGKFLNRTYRREVENLPEVQGDHDSHSPDFPIEKTRLKGAYVALAISVLGTVGYGLALMTRAVSLANSLAR